MGGQHKTDENYHSQNVQDAMVVLDRYHHGLPQHMYGGRGALQPASMVDGISL